MSDLINRQDAIDACMNSKCANIYDCVEAIEKLPSAQDALESAYQEGYTNAESKYREYLPKKGKWMLSEIQREEDTINGNYLYICSCCNFSDTHAKTQIVPYCWHCGADMRGKGVSK